MEIVLGVHLDGKKYPDELQNNSASIGKVITGFNGLIKILETQLGLYTPQVPISTRIAEWQATIDEMITPDKPYAQSFQIDSWNTSQELLQRRDELILAGWNPQKHATGSKWLQTLAEIELKNEHSKGFSDRVIALLQSLKEATLPLSIQSITVIDEDTSLWENWANSLMNVLYEKDIVIKQAVKIVEVTHPSTDLEKILYVLQYPGKNVDFTLTNDQSFVIVRSEQEWDGLDFLTSYLQFANEQTVLINGLNDLVAAEYFHRQGLPASEVQQYSKWRSLLQVLPLTLETYWKPVSVEQLLELYALPKMPLPWPIRSNLAKALSEHPGINSEKWNEAIRLGIEKVHQQWNEKQLTTKEFNSKDQELQEKIKLWVNHERYNPESGIPCEIVYDICAKIIKWAAGNIGNSDATSIELYQHCISTSKALRESIQALKVEKIPKIQLNNILNSIVGSGANLSDYIAEFAPWNEVHQPGAIWDEAETIVWWNFIDTSSKSIQRWTQSERAYLEENGVVLKSSEKSRKLDNLAWSNVIRYAKNRLVLIIPSKIKGGDVKAHPYLDEIRYAFSKINADIQDVTIDAAELQKYASVSMFEHSIERKQLKPHTIPAPIREWKVPANSGALREKESATSFEQLITCPLRWTLQYKAKIRTSVAVTLPNESVMLGNLGHAILEQLIHENLFEQPAQIEQRTRELLEEYIPKMALVLLQPENLSLHRAIVRDLPKSMQRFAEFLSLSTIRIAETEALKANEWDANVQFEGRLDMIGKTAKNDTVILDAKWSRSPKRYHSKLEEGSIQLALYNWMLSEQDMSHIPVAYFMLSNGDVYAQKHSLMLDQYAVVTPPIEDTFSNVQQEVKRVQSILNGGVAIATGIDDIVGEEMIGDDVQQAVEPFLYEPSCKFCDYQDICGKRRELA